MPTYDYVCDACGHALEAFHAMSAPALRTCPKCGKKKLVRKIGAGAGVIFKGSGFYQTDYKSPSRGTPSKEGEGGGASEKGADSEKAAAASGGAGTRGGEKGGGEKGGGEKAGGEKRGGKAATGEKGKGRGGKESA